MSHDITRFLPSSFHTDVEYPWHQSTNTLCSCVVGRSEAYYTHTSHFPQVSGSTAPVNQPLEHHLDSSPTKQWTKPGMSKTCYRRLSPSLTILVCEGETSITLPHRLLVNYNPPPPPEASSMNPARSEPLCFVRRHENGCEQPSPLAATSEKDGALDEGSERITAAGPRRLQKSPKTSLWVGQTVAPDRLFPGAWGEHDTRLQCLDSPLHLGW